MEMLTFDSCGVEYAVPKWRILRILKSPDRGMVSVVLDNGDVLYSSDTFNSLLISMESDNGK